MVRQSVDPAPPSHWPPPLFPPYPSFPRTRESRPQIRNQPLQRHSPHSGESRNPSGLPPSPITPPLNPAPPSVIPSAVEESKASIPPTNTPRAPVLRALFQQLSDPGRRYADLSVMALLRVRRSTRTTTQLCGSCESHGSQARRERICGRHGPHERDRIPLGDAQARVSRRLPPDERQASGTVRHGVRRTPQRPHGGHVGSDSSIGARYGR